MLEVLLIRHGQTESIGEHTSWLDAGGSYDGGWPDGPLTALGAAQAAALSTVMAAFAPQRVLSSDLQRAWRTAELACTSVGVALEQTAALREIHMGRLHREDWDALRQQDPAYFDRWHAALEDVPYPGGESGADTAARAWPVLGELQRQGVQRAAVFAHGGTIRVLASCALGLPQQRRFALGPFENASVTTLCCVQNRWALFACNDVHHLRELGDQLRSL
jgi:2,3-bisphosphoglycerate-dependent phosphoglycerate mutase/probable phosphoglycerate mutase